MFSLQKLAQISKQSSTFYKFFKLHFSFCHASKPLLDGIRVIDLSRILAGPYATMQLSDLGAEVIKVETFEGDETRKWGPPFANDEDSSYFLCANRNKKSICVNLKTNEGRKIIYDLVRISDIIAENYSQGVTQKLKIDYPTLSQLNPKIIYASISGYGDSGPLALAPAFDLVMQARSGFMHVTGQSDGQPTKLGFAISDVITGLNLTNGILAALYHRTQTGRGMHVKTSLQESSIGSLVNVASQYLNGGLEGKRIGNMHPSIVPYGVYKAKSDEYVVIGAGTNDQFKRFCKVIGKESLIDDSKYKTNGDRVKNRIELDSIILDSLKELDADKLAKQLEVNKIPGGRIMSISQMFEDEQVKHLQMAQDVESTKYKNLKLVRNPISYSENVQVKMVEPPSLNQHSEEILKGVLKYSPDKIAALKQNGTII